MMARMMRDDGLDNDEIILRTDSREGGLSGGRKYSSAVNKVFIIVDCVGCVR